MKLKNKLHLLLPGAIVFCLLIFELTTSWKVSEIYGHHYDSTFDAPHEQGSSDRTRLRPYRQKKVYPRTFSVAYNAVLIPVPYTRDFEQNSVPHEAPQITPSWFQPNALDSSNKQCEPMYDWQVQSFPNCNKFHELDLSTMSFVRSGSARSAFELKEDIDGISNKFVYKSIKYRKDITKRKVEEQRKDGLLLERMSSSPFIPDIHGYCSLAVMMDFMPEGSMHDYIKGVRKRT